MKENTVNNITCKLLPDSYSLYINGDIEESTLNDFRKDVNEKIDEIEKTVIEQNTALIAMGIDGEGLKIKLPSFNVYINTYGGDVYAGLGICDIIEELTKNYVVNIICSGYIMSMGIPIILSGTHRIAHKNTSFMIHEISAFSWDKLTKIKEDVKETERLNNILKSIIVEKTKITMKKIDDWYEKKLDVFMSSDEALKCGLIDEIIS